ncbi:MAG: ABC transporter ATP-binding protein [Paracoccaceae bacterium]
MNARTPFDSTPADDPLIRARNLRIAFGAEPVVRGIDFDLNAGECLALVGESGSGKSVTARSLIGLAGGGAQVQSDLLHFRGRDLTRFRAAQWQRLRGRGIGFVLQDALVSLDPLKRVADEVAEAIRAHHPLRGAELEQAILRALSHAGIPEPERRARQYPHELSGGLRQRALIATAIAGDPDLLIADEPTTALDVTVQAQILKLFNTFKAEGKAILLISHDLAAVAQVADRIAVMRAGEIVETGPAAQILSGPRHDYTRMLIGAVPADKPRGTRLSSIPVPPAPSHPTETGHLVAEATGLTKSYHGQTVVRGLGLTLSAGETLGIVGESGSGKTTTSRLLLGLVSPDRGEVRIDGTAWSALTGRRLRDMRQRIQVIWQDPLSSFDPRHTVGRILDEALSVTGLPRSGRRAAATDLLAQVGLSAAMLDRKPLTLSGGQRQRVAIARALAPRPDIIICDEPVSALDVSIQAQVLDLLSDIQRQTGVAYVFISHDLGVVRHVSDRIMVMKDGEVVETGPTEAVLDNPQHPYTRSLIAAVPRLIPKEVPA